MKPITDFPYTPSLFTDKRFFWNRKTKEELAKPINGESDHQALLAICQNERKLFRLISTFVPSVGGWTSVQKACAMAGLVLAMRPKVVCEVGVFCGRSLISMALALQKLGSGKAIGIDPYSAQASVEGEVGANVDYWSSQSMHDDVLKQFLGYVSNFKLNNVIHLLQKKSDDVDVPKDIEIFSLDGNHTEQAVRDVERFAPNVVLGGIVIADDTSWNQGGVLRAIDVLTEEMGFRECYSVKKSGNGESDDWMVLQKAK